METLQPSYNIKLGLQENLSYEGKTMGLDGAKQIRHTRGIHKIAASKRSGKLGEICVVKDSPPPNHKKKDSYYGLHSSTNLKLKAGSSE